MHTVIPSQAAPRGGNILDSTAPQIRRGKEREQPKKRKPTPLRKVITREKEERKKNTVDGGAEATKNESSGGAEATKEVTDNELEAAKIETGVVQLPSIETVEVTNDETDEEEVTNNETEVGICCEELDSPLKPHPPINTKPSLRPVKPHPPNNAGLLKPSIHNRKFRE